MLALLSAVHVIVCLFLILVVLLQQGKGADLSVFGGGGTQAAFGARGATTLLHKLTVFGFIAFIITTMAIGLLKTQQRNESVITDLPAAVEESVLPTAEPLTDDAATPDSAIEATPEASMDAAAEEAAPTTEGDGGDGEQ